jgi:hypothetical protein
MTTAVFDGSSFSTSSLVRRSMNGRITCSNAPNKGLLIWNPYACRQAYTAFRCADDIHGPSTDLVQAGDDEQLLLLLQRLPHVLGLTLCPNGAANALLLTMTYGLVCNVLMLCCACL